MTLSSPATIGTSGQPPMNAVKWEESRGGQLFPHLYGTLSIAQLDSVQWVEPNKAG